MITVRDPEYGTTNYQSFWVLLPPDFPVSRDELLTELADAGVSARRGIMAAHLEPAYADWPCAPLPVTERMTRDSLILPLFHEMTEGEQDHVVSVIHAAAWPGQGRTSPPDGHRRAPGRGRGTSMRFPRAGSGSLLSRATHALGWSFINNAASRLGTLGIGIVLARLLGPHAFGAFAVALVALAMLLSFNELGVSLAIVRWQGEPSEIAPTVATISIATSVLIYIGCFFGAPAFSPPWARQKRRTSSACSPSTSSSTASSPRRSR